MDTWRVSSDFKSQTIRQLVKWSRTLNLSSTEARELSNSGESRNSQGNIGCKKLKSLRTLTLPVSSRPNLSVLVRYCIAYASPAWRDIIVANSGDTNRLNCNRDTCVRLKIKSKKRINDNDASRQNRSCWISTRFYFYKDLLWKDRRACGKLLLIQDRIW